MITLHKIRDLPLSAASGLVIRGDYLHVIADDALHLHSYSLRDPYYERRVRLREGELPAEKKARKKMKPDFEALALLPAQADVPQGALLALGSGSKKNRQQAVLVPLDAQQQPALPVTSLDLAPLYGALALDDCNIEGAVVCGAQLVLLQRGNQRHEQSALVFVPLASISPCEVGGVPAGRGGHPPGIIYCSLPMRDGVPLGFTDGLLLPNGNILFAAVAEVTDDSYHDGACLGAAVGEISLQGELLRCQWLPGPHKIEGIALDDSGRLHAVTDADDPSIPAQLLLLEGWR